MAVMLAYVVLGADGAGTAGFVQSWFVEAVLSGLVRSVLLSLVESRSDPFCQSGIVWPC